MTLYTSDTKQYAKVALVYLLITIFCGAFGAIYEVFSFGVYSYFMLYAFAFPLVGGVLPALIFASIHLKFTPGRLCLWPYRCGIATLTVGSILCGVLEIYGTDNTLLRWYWYIGAALIAGAAMVFAVKALCKRK